MAEKLNGNLLKIIRIRFHKKVVLFLKCYQSFAIEIQLDFFQKPYFFYFSDFRRKTSEEERKVALPNKYKINTKWIYVGASLTVFCLAITVGIGIIRLGRRSSKGNINFILI